MQQVFGIYISQRLQQEHGFAGGEDGEKGMCRVCCNAPIWSFLKWVLRTFLQHCYTWLPWIWARPVRAGTSTGFLLLCLQCLHTILPSMFSGCMVTLEHAQKMIIILGELKLTASPCSFEIECVPVTEFASVAPSSILTLISVLSPSVLTSRKASMSTPPLSQ